MRFHDKDMTIIKLCNEYSIAKKKVFNLAKLSCLFFQICDDLFIKFKYNKV